MKKLPLLLLFLLSQITFAQHTITSPDGHIKVTVQKTGSAITYAIQYRNEPLLQSSEVGLLLQNGMVLPGNSRIKKVNRKSVSTTITSPVPEKRKMIPDTYNELTIDFVQPVSLQFRVYNDGVAYRFLTRFTDSLIIQNETAAFYFPGNPLTYFPEVQKRPDADSFHTSFEEPYQRKPLDSLSTSTLCFTPVLVKTKTANVVLTESDLEDYPGMFVTGNSGNALLGKFAPYPLADSVTTAEFPQVLVTKRAGYIARTKGSRSYPWRVLAIAADDRQLPANDIVYRLASPSRISNTSWIRPGKGTDEWIIDIRLFNVPFKAGINTETYKFYIDFAKRFGFDRIMMDAGWSDVNDLFKINPNLNMEEIAAYAKSKGIGLSMWTLAQTLDRQLEPALEQFKKWGVSFIMTDFMDRDDQPMVNFYHRVAEACAKEQIMVMYHGAFKPAGFTRTWPHALTREGVLGSEFNAWSHKASPEHNVLQPFIRMVAGPMDYEPGLLDNATQETFRPIWGKVMSQGTRCHQLAMFVVYDSPLQLFAGNPSQGLLEPQFMELLGSIPTTWDETIIPAAQLGEYIVTARKKGADWFIGGMTNWTPRSLNMPLDFLEEGIYEATICADGINADRAATDYAITTKTIRKGDQLSINMAPGGGYMVRLRKKGL